jgi:hypothetical protein
MRPPHTGRKPFGRPHGKPQHQYQHQQHSRPKPKPKPLIPLTKAMKEGKEPLRTFGDLVQFYQAKTEPEAPKPPMENAAAPKKQAETQRTRTEDSLPTTDAASVSVPSPAVSNHEPAAKVPASENRAASDNVTGATSAAETSSSDPQPAESVG